MSVRQQHGRGRPAIVVIAVVSVSISAVAWLSTGSAWAGRPAARWLSNFNISTVEAEVPGYVGAANAVN